MLFHYDHLIFTLLICNERAAERSDPNGSLMFHFLEETNSRPPREHATRARSRRPSCRPLMSRASARSPTGRANRLARPREPVQTSDFRRNCNSSPLDANSKSTRIHDRVWKRERRREGERDQRQRRGAASIASMEMETSGRR